ncbi:MAG: hypothetical protein E6Q97_24690 [Desulfurellales bacterium]|nr:MAG: hypothetical protein E6Q97_24690 [Desulfurellales bacterium]
MAWPFTPLVTFLSKSVPKVTHTFLNSLQAAQNALFAPVYHHRPSIYVESTNGTQVAVYAASLTVKDSATGEYVYIEQVGRTVTTTWPVDAWRYLYLVSTSGVASVEISSTAPATGIAGPLFKTGDETRRYLCAVRCDPGGNVVKFSMVDGRYLWLDEHQVLTGGATGTGAWVTLAMPAFVAPHARRALLTVRITNSAASVQGVSFRSFGVGSMPLKVVANSFAERDLTIPVAGDSMEWNAPATTTIDAIVRGWEE